MNDLYAGGKDVSPLIEQASVAELELPLNLGRTNRRQLTVLTVLALGGGFVRGACGAARLPISVEVLCCGRFRGEPLCVVCGDRHIPVARAAWWKIFAADEAVEERPPMNDAMDDDNNGLGL